MVIQFSKKEHRNFSPAEKRMAALHKEYFVFEVTYDPAARIVEVVIQDPEDDTPVLINAEHIEFIDCRIPEDWVFHLLLSGSYRLSPQEFLGDFWDKYFDGDEESEALFESARQKIIRFHAL